jgi:hypothetical protein
VYPDANFAILVNSKKSISVLLFLIMFIQVLPLQQIAAWLFKNQVTEELAHNINPVKVKSGTDDAHPPFSSNEFNTRILRAINMSSYGLLHDEELFTRHADDIPTPPPNC